jgi:hypothetical protein
LEVQNRKREVADKRKISSLELGIPPNSPGIKI